VFRDSKAYRVMLEREFRDSRVCKAVRDLEAFRGIKDSRAIRDSEDQERKGLKVCRVTLGRLERKASKVMPG
jgi:hypothetical protein